MAANKLNLRVSAQDFNERISVIDIRMAVLMDVITEYERARESMGEFIESGDDNYDSMINQIEEHIRTAKAAYNALGDIRAEMDETVQKMGNMGTEIGETITAAIDATKETVEAALKVSALL